MKVRFLFGPKFGTEEHISPKDAMPLIAAGIAVAAEPVRKDGSAPPKPGDFRAPEPDWEVVLRPRLMSGGEELAIRMTIMGTDYFYSGQPEHANAKVVWDGGHRYLSGLGREVPKEILKEYEKQWKKNENLRAPSTVTLDEHNASAMAAFMRAR